MSGTEALRLHILAALGWIEARGVTDEEVIAIEIQAHRKPEIRVHLRPEAAKRRGLTATTVRTTNNGRLQRCTIDGVHVVWVD